MIGKLERVLELRAAASPAEVAEELARSRLIVALVGDRALTLDSLLALAARGSLSSASIEEAEATLPRMSSRMGLRRALECYLASGSKYGILRARRTAALTPRSLASIAGDAIGLLDVAGAAARGAPAMVGPNATLRGALRRMARRKSICAFVVRAGRVRGVVDAWTALRLAAGEGEEVLEMSCSEVASQAPLRDSYRGLLQALAEYGFAALVGREAPLLVDDVSLLQCLREAFGRWRDVLPSRRRRLRRGS